VDDTQRLKCFDSLIPKKIADPPLNKKSEIFTTWSIIKSKSPLDGSPEISAMLSADESDVVLVLRCRKKHTDVTFIPRRHNYLGSSQKIRMFVRIGNDRLIETNWTPSTNGHSAYAPHPIQFIRALPDNEKLFLRAIGYDGTAADGTFNLGDVSSVRKRISTACHWPGAESSKKQQKVGSDKSQ